MISRLAPLSGIPSSHPDAERLAPAPEPRFDRKPLWLRVTEPSVDSSDVEAVRQVAASGFVSSAGPEVERFEAELAKACDTEFALALSCGTHALELLLYSLDLQPGDEVIVPDLTFISVAAAVLKVGARPVFVDVEPDSLNLSAATVEPHLGAKTRGIIAVHTYGYPADMDALSALAEKHRLFLLEDSCEALGAQWKGRAAGGLGDAAAHSFYANKMLTTGNGGAITTNHRELFELARKLRGYSYEAPRLFWHAHPPFNFRMSALQAALGRSQLQRLPEFLEHRENMAKSYNAALSSIPGLHLPSRPRHGKHANWMYVLQISPEEYGMSAEDLRQELAWEGIETRAVFAPLHVQPVLQSPSTPPQGPFPVSAQVAKNGLLLPSGLQVGKREVEAVCEVISESFGRRR